MGLFSFIGGTKRDGEKSPLDFSLDEILRVEHVSKSFPDNEHGEKIVLHDINFSVRKSERVLLYARSGRGKSVLLHCISGYDNNGNPYLPTGGRILLFGADRHSLTREQETELAVHVTVAYQSSALFQDMTLYENLAFPLAQEVFQYAFRTEIEHMNPAYHTRSRREQERLKQDLINMRVSSFLESVGIEKQDFSKRPRDISGGMRKRVGVARSLSVLPELVLVDEPTTGLDPITQKDIFDLFDQFQKRYNVSFFITTHYENFFVLNADRILLMHMGRIYFDGTSDDLRASDDPFVRTYFDPHGLWKSHSRQQGTDSALPPSLYTQPEYLSGKASDTAHLSSPLEDSLQCLEKNSAPKPAQREEKP